jgi:hypothetical protein
MDEIEHISISNCQNDLRGNEDDPTLVALSTTDNAVDDLVDAELPSSGLRKKKPGKKKDFSNRTRIVLLCSP